ncbi:MAG TPA: hypothetical protein VGD99_16935 [Anaerolineae bacterium]
MKKKLCFNLVCLLMGLALGACGPSPAEPNIQATHTVTSTLIAQIAVAPTLTPMSRTTSTHTPTQTPTPTNTPSPTRTSTATSTPTPTPTATFTPVPTDTPTPTATHTSAPTAVPTSTPTPVKAASPLAISWSEQMVYEGRAGESRWCQINMTYTNNSTQTYSWPDYRPVFQIVNADGAEAYAVFANYYQKSQGWPNGIEGTPPDIPAGSSAEWTWYSVSEQPGQSCALVTVIFQDWLYIAHYDAGGQLVNTEVQPPQ